MFFPSHYLYSIFFPYQVKLTQVITLSLYLPYFIPKLIFKFIQIFNSKSKILNIPCKLNIKHKVKTIAFYTPTSKTLTSPFQQNIPSQKHTDPAHFHNLRTPSNNLRTPRAPDQQPPKAGAHPIQHPLTPESQSPIRPSDCVLPPVVRYTSALRDTRTFVHISLFLSTREANASAVRENKIIHPLFRPVTYGDRVRRFP